MDLRFATLSPDSGAVERFPSRAKAERCAKRNAKRGLLAAVFDLQKPPGANPITVARPSQVSGIVFEQNMWDNYGKFAIDSAMYRAGELHPDELTSPAATPLAGEEPPSAAEVSAVAGQNSPHPAGAEVTPTAPVPARSKTGLDPKRRRA